MLFLVSQTQSVFSLGYGEDDDKEGDTLTVPLGAGRLVSAVDEVSLRFYGEGQGQTLVKSSVPCGAARYQVGSVGNVGPGIELGATLGSRRACHRTEDKSAGS